MCTYLLISEFNLKVLFKGKKRRGICVVYDMPCIPAHHGDLPVKSKPSSTELSALERFHLHLIFLLNSVC